MRVAATTATRTLRDRLRAERGQTAAEYLGILVLVALIIAALATLGLGDDIANRIRDLIQSVGEGSSAPTVTSQP